MINVPADENERQRLISEARQISVALPVLGPLLDRRKLNALQRLMGDYRDGKQNQNAVAEIFVIDSIQAELRAKLENLNLIGG